MELGHSLGVNHSTWVKGVAVGGSCFYMCQRNNNPKNILNHQLYVTKLRFHK